MEEKTHMTTTMRIEIDLYDWIREYTYNAGRTNRTRCSINQAINELLAEAIEARKQSQATESK
jgi:hypothetical protein